MSGTAPGHEDFQIVEGQLLTGSSHYEVQAFLGEGVYGKVAKCLDVDTNKTVAVKILKLKDGCIQHADKEVAFLTKLRDLDLVTCNIVSLYECFTQIDHPCIVFEMLDVSLEDFMDERQFKPLPLTDIRTIIKQLATALKALKSIGLIHSDLKPDNIMLVDRVRQPFRVKLIDFGSATPASEAECGTTCQALLWRSPEILLGLPFSEAIDMWALGCVAIELFLGVPPYPGECEYDMIHYIIHALGQPEDHLLSRGEKTDSFFLKETHGCHHVWRLKTPEEYEQETGIMPTVVEKKSSTLKDLFELNLPFGLYVDQEAEDLDRLKFLNFVQHIFTLDAAKRMTPSQALEHPFLTMSHEERYSSQNQEEDADKVQACREKLEPLS